MSNEERESQTTLGSDTTVPPEPGTGTTPETENRKPTRNGGRFNTKAASEPYEFFSIGVSGRIRRNPSV
ncbi:hypothetical protein AB0J90_25500 [Micromonospora sp. NPDC049523]|uniref:hypothetical protein n=1 Tax=Micromonospora sp. NPDC049523 TaxID=3155921 RepID=UPI0034475C59